MTKKRILIGVAAAAVVAGGTAGAVAATNGSDKAEQEVLSSAAKKLGVTAEELKSALSSAESEQLDQAVKDGKLTQEQADAIKARQKSGGSVLGFGHGGPGGHPGGPGFGPGGPGFGGPGMFRGAAVSIADEAAKALGITREKLFEQLRDGKTPAEIAKAAGKDLDDVKAAVKAAATKQLDQAVKDNKLTSAQRDEILKHLTEGIDNLGDHGFGPGGPGGPGRGGPGFFHHP